MKCPKCELEVSPLPEVKSNGVLISVGGHDVDGKVCLTRQLAAKSAECDEWKLKYELATVKCTCEFADGPTLASCVERCLAALSRAEGKDDGR